MDYNKPSKKQKDEAYLKYIGRNVNKNPYKEEDKEINEKFLIICEGENTEYWYFYLFPVLSNTVKIEGGCNSKNKLVDYALEQKKLPEYENYKIWCVYDYDIKPDEVDTQPNDFNSSIQRAEANGIKVAWSNDAFELWFVLHYQALNTPLSRHGLYDILKEKWVLESFHNEAKTNVFCKGHYARHISLQEIATNRARKLHKEYGTREDYANHCPCTTVYQLVEELNKNLKK